jgi:hypothetical protein
MKKIKHSFAIIAAILAIFTTVDVSAQNTPEVDSRDTRLGLGLNLGVPTTDGYNFVIGGDLRLQKDFSSNVSGIASIGYNNYSFEDGNADNSLGVIPLKVGIKVFPLERLYLSGEIGAGFNATDKEKLGVDPGTAFIYSPGIGLGFNNGLDLSLRYEGLSRKAYDPGMVALRIAYGFNLSR